MANQVGFDPNAGFPPGGMNSVLFPGEVMPGVMPSANVQPNLASQLASQNHVAHPSAGSLVQASPQLPLSQAQCEQFLNFLKCHMATGSSTDAKTSHQAASVMTSYPSIPQSSPCPQQHQVLHLMQHPVHHLVLHLLLQILTLLPFLHHLPCLQLPIPLLEDQIDPISLLLTYLSMLANLSALSPILACHMIFQLIWITLTLAPLSSLLSWQLIQLLQTLPISIKQYNILNGGLPWTKR